MNLQTKVDGRPLPEDAVISIYKLLDPNTNRIRYVGATLLSIEQRVSEHLKDARRTEPTHKRHWLKLLASQDQVPLAMLLEKTDKHNWQTREQYWIKHFRECGEPLTNGTNGGEGLLGLRHTDSTKAKISLARLGRKASEETRARMSESHKGHQHAQETKQKISKANKGKIRTAEQCEQFKKSWDKNDPSRRRKTGETGKRNKGRKPSVAQREKMLAVLHSPESRTKSGATRTGRRLSEATKRRMSDAAKHRQRDARGSFVSTSKREGA